MAAAMVLRCVAVAMWAPIVAAESADALAGPDAAQDGRRLAPVVNQSQPHPDQEPSTCTLGQSCTDAGMPALRGICVIAVNPGAGKACWDVCNPAHTPESYKVDSNPAVAMSYVGIVKVVRAGLNPMVRCPNLVSGDPCPPGELCPAPMLSQAKLPSGRGLCVIDPNVQGSRACWDMCNYRRNIDDFTIGTPAGTGKQVTAARASGICPGTPWYFIPLVLLGVIAIIGCCGAAFWAVKTLGAKKLRSRQPPLADKRFDPDEGQGQDYYSGDQMLEEAPMELQQDQRGFEPPLTHTPPPMQEPIASLYESGSQGQQSQRSMQPPAQMMSAPDLGLGSPYGGAGVLSPKGPDITALPPGGSMRIIPGLDEPHLPLPSMQVPGGADPFNQQFVLGTTQPAQPQMIQSFHGQPQVGMPSFHTQVPSSYIVPASGSVQLMPGAAGPAPGGYTTMAPAQGYSTLMRR